MYLLLTPLETTSPEVLAHNTLFFKGLWQLESISMKFEAIIGQARERQRAAIQMAEETVSASTIGGAHSPSKSASALPAHLPTFDPACRLCSVAGPLHAHHQSHGPVPPAPKEPLLALLFVTAPQYCPTPPQQQQSALGATAVAANGAGTTTTMVTTTTTTGAPAGVPPGVDVPASSAPSATAWVHLRGVDLLRWLREAGRGAQLIDVVDIDWTSGIVTAWCNRTYVNYVRKCSSFAQVCIVDFEQMRVVAPPRSVVHLKATRSLNIR